MPAVDSILSTIIHSVKGATFRILRTVEVDGYDDTPEAVELARALAARQPNAATLSRLLATKPTGDNFAGTARKAAKLSIATAAVDPFSDLQTVIQTLVADDKMIHRKPPITVTADSNRVAPEKRNVRVKSFLYAASREDDNDFHLIIGRDPARTPEMYMTAELSGLPPQNAASFTKLKAARDAFKAFFGAHLPGFTYDFYDPPIPVVIEGSFSLT